MQIEQFIKQAEVMLIGGKTFDDERTRFIKNLNTCDLLAVPGSGKTTALIAKLYCIAQNMPFEDGSGILVLAHTNHAVEEIGEKLKRHFPQLFHYPNYVGTIQGFVNKFLANQACMQKYGSYININDNEIYEKEASYFLNSLQWKKTEPKGLKNKLFGKVNVGKDTLTYEDKIENIRKFLTHFELDLLERKLIYNGTTFYTYSGSSQSYYIQLEEWKETLYRKGVLNFTDSFRLGNWYAKTFSKITVLLQNRFKYVFIDEMQDLEDSQIKLLDDIFYCENSKTVIQRIGDINQSIYSSGKKVKVECDWTPRCPEYLNNSHRLTNEVAKLVNCFTLDPQNHLNGQSRFKVEGLHKLDSPIKPHLLIFDKNTAGIKLQNKFEDLIKAFNLDKTDSGKKNGFKIIGWSTVWDNDEQKSDINGNIKIRLKDLFCDYSKESKAKKEHFDCLKKYLQLYDHEKKTFEAVRKSILNALVQVLRIEDIHKANIMFRKSSLMEFIRNKGDEDYNNFKAKLFQWCFDLVVKKELDEVCDNVKHFIEEDFIKWNWLNEEDLKPRFIEKSKDFINSSNYDFQKIRTIDIDNETDLKNPYNIEINSVHAIKGQTHCATMYVETAYKNPVYETLKIKEQSRNKSKKKQKEKTNPFFFESHSCEGLEAKNALKMMYVGFSRPTHLLCFAALKENIDDTTPYGRAGWEIINLTVPTLQTGGVNA